MGWLELADTNFWAGQFDRDQMLSLTRPVFDGPIIANGGIDPQTAQQLIANGSIDAVSFGRLWMANPDLQRVFWRVAPFIKRSQNGFMGAGPMAITTIPPWPKRALCPRGLVATWRLNRRMKILTKEATPWTQ